MPAEGTALYLEQLHPISKKPIFCEEALKEIKCIKAHINLDCCSDLPPEAKLNLYLTTLDNEELYCMRGSNASEIYHKCQQDALGSHNMSPLYFVYMTALYDFRYNIDRGIHKLNDANYYHYNHQRLEQLKTVLSNMNVTDFKDLPLTSDWKTTGISMYVNNLDDLLLSDSHDSKIEDDNIDNDSLETTFLQGLTTNTLLDERLKPHSVNGIEMVQTAFNGGSPLAKNARITPSEHGLALLMSTDARAVVVPQRLITEEYVLFTNMVASGKYFNSGSLNTGKFTHDWNTIVLDKKVPNIRHILPFIVTKIYDVYKRNQSVKKASVVSKSSLVDLTCQHRFTSSPNITFPTPMKLVSLTLPTTAAPTELETEPSTSIFGRSASALIGAYVS